MDKRIPLYVAGVVFALVAILHAWRIATGTLILVGTEVVPLSVSWIGLIVSALLSIWMFLSTCCCSKKSCYINGKNNNSIDEKH